MKALRNIYQRFFYGRPRNPEFRSKGEDKITISTMNFIKAMVFGVLLAATAASLPAQNPAEEQVIRQFFANADIAWNHHDAQQLTNTQTTIADADFVNVYGGWTKGRDNFVTTMSRLQAGPFHDITRHTVVEKIRFVRPDVVVVITTNIDRHGDGPPSETLGTFVLSKEGGRWLLNSFQNTQISAPPAAARPPQSTSGSPK